MQSKALAQLDSKSLIIYLISFSSFFLARINVIITLITIGQNNVTATKETERTAITRPRI